MAAYKDVTVAMDRFGKSVRVTLPRTPRAERVLARP